jgi:hypothetical protein
VAVTLIAILHAIPDSDDPHGKVARLMDRMPTGYLAMSLLGREFLAPETLREVQNTSSRMIQGQFAWRSRDQVERFFAGMDLVAPGLVRVEDWRTEPGTDESGESPLWCAVGRNADARLA